MRGTFQEDTIRLQQNSADGYDSVYKQTAAHFENSMVIKSDNTDLIVRSTFFDNELEGGAGFGLYSQEQIFNVSLSKIMYIFLKLECYKCVFNKN